jgi:hypothetical protein
MDAPASMPEPPVLGRRLKLGIALFALSLLLPLLGLPALALFDLSARMRASLYGGILAAGEILGIAAVAVMGKIGYAYVKGRFVGLLKQHGPPREVSRLRYTLGLVMFSVPILYGWVSPYAAELIPGLKRAPLAFALAGDLLLVASLFVLGGKFWDKLRSLFVHDAEISFAMPRARPHLGNGRVI